MFQLCFYSQQMLVENIANISGYLDIAFFDFAVKLLAATFEYTVTRKDISDE